MKKILFFSALTIVTAGVLIGCATFGDSLHYINNDLKLGKINRIVYINPDIFPEFDGLEEPTNQAFFSAMSDKMHEMGDINVKRIDTPMPYDEVDLKTLKSLVNNNLGDLIIVPKVKYFKVGMGKYVFSNQVVVNMKIYDRMGNFVMEVGYDTYSGNARLLGSAENSVKLGTTGALNKMFKELRKRKMVEGQFS